MKLKEIKGLKYPDEYFIKFFFKFALHSFCNKKYLELGCSNGCNLMLPFEFDNSVVGVDMDKTLISYAEHNFALGKSSCACDFVVDDMREFCKNKKDIYADVLVLANSIYYIPQDDFVLLLRNVLKNNLIKKDIPFFVRFRLVDDFRNNKGKAISKNAIIMDNKVTGEDGVFCRFYELDEMVGILQKELGLREFQTMQIKYENIQNNTKVTNSDAVIWGVIN